MVCRARARGGSPRPVGCLRLSHFWCTFALWEVDGLAGQADSVQAWLPFGRVGLSAPGTGSAYPIDARPGWRGYRQGALVLVATVSWRRLLVVIGLALFASAASAGAASAHRRQHERRAPRRGRRARRRRRAALTGRTRGHGADARAAAAAVTGDEHLVGSWGPLTDWPVVGVHVALMPDGKVLAYDSVGDNATETYRTTRSPARRCGIRRRHAHAGDRAHGVQRLLQRARASARRQALRRRRQQELVAAGHRQTHVSTTRAAWAWGRHVGRALVPERHAAEQRRDADHGGRARTCPRCGHDRRDPAAEHRVAQPAALPVARRGAGRARVLLGAGPDDARWPPAARARGRRSASATRSTATTAATRCSTSARSSSPAAADRAETRA